MQNERPGARKHQSKAQGKDGEVLSPVEAAALHRGQILKRHVRAAAALNDLYDDASLGEAIDLGRGAVAGWWRGARPSPDSIYRLADVTGLSPDELTRFVYSDGPPPTLPLHDPTSEQELAAVREAERAAGTPSSPPLGVQRRRSTDG